jgi:hypothetical protein
MFICDPCHQDLYGSVNLHSTSRGPCEICLKTAACADCKGHAERSVTIDRVDKNGKRLP